MTITNEQLILYFGAIFILFITPGPVWVAIIARTVSGGFKSSISLVLGVSLGDMLWPILVYFGLGFLISIYSDILMLMKYLASLILCIMGMKIILSSTKIIRENDQLKRIGFLPGFTAGFFAVTANPKASLFYLSFLPSVFDFSQIGVVDILLISSISFSVPMLGNIFIILLLSKLKVFLTSENYLNIIKNISGISLIGVGIVVGFKS